jgi:hypothetical protein
VFAAAGGQSTSILSAPSARSLDVPFCCPCKILDGFHSVLHWSKLSKIAKNCWELGRKMDFSTDSALTNNLYIYFAKFQNLRLKLSTASMSNRSFRSFIVGGDRLYGFAVEYSPANLPAHTWIPYKESKTLSWRP